VTKAVPTQSCFAPTYTSADAIQMTPGQELLPGQSLNNKSGTATMVMQSDGNLVIYLLTEISSYGPALWSSNTSGNAGAYVYMQTDGNFVIYDRNGGPSINTGALWSTKTNGNAGAVASFGGDANFQMLSTGGAALFQTHTGQAAGAVCQATDPGIPANLPNGSWLASKTAWLIVQQDGNLVLYPRNGGSALWSSNTPGKGPVHLVMQADGNLVLYSTEANGVQLGALWSSQTNNFPGSYALLQDDGNFVVYTSNGSPTTGGSLWSTNTRA
jgi:hypothetical protein